MNNLETFLHNLSSQKVVIWGLGLNGGGVGAAKFFATYAAEVIVTDLKTETELQEVVTELEDHDNITWRLGEHREADFFAADLIVRNPAIPPHVELLQKLKQQGKQVIMQAALFTSLTSAYTVGITGTRGKSTVTAMLVKILQATGEKVVTGGNNKVSLLQKLPEVDEDTIVVMELSSFQLHGFADLEVSPNLAVVTNMYADHLNWHGSMQDYIEAKQNIVRYQDQADMAVLSADNKIVTTNFPQLVPGKHLSFGEAGDIVSMEGSSLYWQKEELLKLEEMKVGGKHNLENAAAAATAAAALNIPQNTVRSALLNFQGLEYRQQLVATKNNITFINDSTSTMPEATLASLQRFVEQEGRRAHLIVGGVNKQVNLTNLLQTLEAKAESVHVLEGSFYEQVLELVEYKLPANFVGPFADLAAAFASALQSAQAGDYIIFSPAAASFNMFVNEWERGKAFNNLVNSL